MVVLIFWTQLNNPFCFLWVSSQDDEPSASSKETQVSEGTGAEICLNKKQVRNARFMSGRVKSLIITNLK